MMFLKSSEKLSKKMVAIRRDFLWGYNSDRGKRIPLVAWERLAWPKVSIPSDNPAKRILQPKGSDFTRLNRIWNKNLAEQEWIQV